MLASLVADDDHGAAVPQPRRGHHRPALRAGVRRPRGRPGRACSSTARTTRPSSSASTRASCGASTSSSKPSPGWCRHHDRRRSADRRSATGSASSKVIAVLRASHVSALAPVCDVLVEEGILSLELTLTTPGLLDALPELVDRYASRRRCWCRHHPHRVRRRTAMDCGAQYLVTPTMNLPVVRLAVAAPGCGLPRRPDSDRARRRLAGRRDRGQDLSRADGRRRVSQASARPVPRPAGRPVRRGRPRRQPCNGWLPARSR